MNDAERLFAKAFATSMRRFSMIFTFRETGYISLAVGTPTIAARERMFTEDMLSNPEHDKLFKDKAGFIEIIESMGGIEKVAEFGPKQKIAQFEAAIDASSLVFAHSIVDSNAYDYCLVTSMLEPQSWESLIDKKKIQLSEIKEQSYSEILSREVSKFILSLERESLLKKVDLLFSICKPPRDFAPINDFQYDRARLEELDKLRHEIVHGSGPIKLPNGPADIRYPQRTSSFLMALVNERFGIKVDPNEIKRHLA
jgi:hypothetical protein